MARLLNIFQRNFYNNQICSFGSNLFSFMDVFLILLSIGSFLVDIGTDIIVVIQYYLNGHIMWMLLTTSLVCIPSLVVQIFSIRWHIIDRTVTNFLWLIHILQLGVFQRYMQLLSLGLKMRRNSSRREDLNRFHQQQSDICMLRLFESFMESAPQLVLQLYIMVSTDEWNPWTGISAIASIFSLGWGIAAYSKAMRNIRPEKKHLSWWGLLFQSLWRIGMVSSRVFAMVLFAAAYGSWLIVAIAIHWLCMTVWVFLQKTDFCATWWEERLYNCVVGVIYCFCYFNIKEGQSRFRMSIYYSLTILQNLSFLLAFYTVEKSSDGFKFLMILLVPCGIVIGLISMMLYYRFFHPSGIIRIFTQNTKVDSIVSAKNHQCTCCTLKTCRKNVNKSGNLTCKRVDSSQPLSTDFTDHVENMNSSRISITSKPENAVTCAPDLHRSHSLNCSYVSNDISKISDSSFEVNIHSHKSSANHHRNINYHFRPAANPGLLSSKIHCSCLVLMSHETNIKNHPVTPFIKHCNSLPNLDGSFDSETSKIIESSFISHVIEDTVSDNSFIEKEGVTGEKDLVINNDLIQEIENSNTIKDVSIFAFDTSKTVESPIMCVNNEALSLNNATLSEVSINGHKNDIIPDTGNVRVLIKQSKSLSNVENTTNSNITNFHTKSPFISCIELSATEVNFSSLENLLSDKIEYPVINKDHIIYINL